VQSYKKHGKSKKLSKKVKLLAQKYFLLGEGTFIGEYLSRE